VIAGEIPVAVEAELARLRAENARLLRLSPQQAAPPGPAQGAFFEAAPGIVHHRSPQDAKVAFFGALLAELLLRHPELVAEAEKISSALLVVDDQELIDEIATRLRALGLTWAEHGEALLRRRKPWYYGQEPRPGVSVIGARLTELVSRR
jgi:hypothetical protein